MAYRTPFIQAAALALCLAGCTPQQSEPAPEGNQTDQPEATAQADETGMANSFPLAGNIESAKPDLSLEGEWRVAGIDGEEVDLPVALTLSVGKQIIDWDPRCAQLAHRYRIAGATLSAPRIRQFVTDAARDGAKAPLHQAPCAIGLPERLSDAMEAMESATRIERTEANGIRLSGYGRSLTLFAQ